MKSKIRNSNFELMRVISMLLIVTWHIISHGNMMKNCENDSVYFILSIIQFIIIIHVNSYMLLSGYYQSRSHFKLSKFLQLLLQVMFYSAGLYIVAVQLKVVDSFNISTLIDCLLPSSVNGYWFIKAYVAVYLLSDIINKLINSMDQKQYKNTLIVLFILFSIAPFLTGNNFFENNGMNFFSFIYLYMLGGYLGRYPMKETYYFKKFSKSGYKLLLVFLFFLMAFLNYSIIHFAHRLSNLDSILSGISNRLLATQFTYLTPCVLIQSICYFLYFEALDIKNNKIINLVSSTAFGVYLFHDNDYVRIKIYEWFKIDNGPFTEYSMLGRLVAVALAIFLIGFLIELIRKLIIKILLRFKLTNKIINGFRNYINSFKFKINW